MGIDSEILSQLKLDEENESGEKYIPEYLYLFRKAIEDMENMMCPMDDIFLLRFLRTRKFNVKLSVKLLHNYFEMRTKVPEMGKHCFSTLKTIYEKRLFTVMKSRDSEGRKIIYFRFAKWNPEEFTFPQIMASGFYLCEELTRSEETQKNGIVVIVDGDQLTFNRARKIAMQITFDNIRVLSPRLQDAYPVLYKGIHLVNCPLIFHFVFYTVRMFWKEKLKRRAHIHGSNIKTLHKFINDDILPKELGGIHSIEDVEDKQLVQSMFGREDYFKRLHTVYGYQDATTN